MAFAAMEVVAGYIGSAVRRGDGHPILSLVTGSDPMAAPGVSTVIAPPVDASNGQPAFYLLANAPSYGAVGKNPDPSPGKPRFPIQANVPFPIYVNGGDKFAWAAA